jgi:hypothetical protein
MPAPPRSSVVRSALGLLIALLVLSSAALASASQNGALAPGGAMPTASVFTDPVVNCAQSDDRAFGAKCGPGNNRKTAGGKANGDVSHKGWPAVSGIFWENTDNRKLARAGTNLNDELLGGAGNDRIDGGYGNDIIWGDSKPSPNGTGQHDSLSGGPGRDFIYTSHGANVVHGGPGNDYIFAYYGHGTIDCGGGYDQVKVRLGTGQYKLKNCEQRLTFCTFGSVGNRCLKPGEKKAVRHAVRTTRN